MLPEMDSLARLQRVNGTRIQVIAISDETPDRLRPVIDETGRAGRYNILTENVVRTEEDMLAALKKWGLTFEKADREMDVAVLSRPAP